LAAIFSLPYNKVICLWENASNPCLFTGHVLNPSNPADSALSSPLTLGLYVDDFVYFSEDPATKHRFETLLSTPVTVEFMGTVEWFLGTHFQWLATDNIVSIHLSQTGFAAHLVEDNNIHTRNITHNATPYHSGLPIDAIPKSDEPNDCPALVEQKRKYQSVVGSIGWLAQSTRGMVHANVGQKLLKRNIFKSFYRVSKLRSSR
jgi:hypothetical protein